MNPTELIKEARAEVKAGTPRNELKLKIYFIRFRKYLQDKQLADMTVKMRLAGIKSFYQLHDIDVPVLPKGGNRGKARTKKENKV